MSAGYFKFEGDWLCCYCGFQSKKKERMVKHSEKWHDEDWKKEYGFYAESRMSADVQNFYRMLYAIQRCVKKQDAERIQSFKRSVGIPFGSPQGNIPNWIWQLAKDSARLRD